MTFIAANAAQRPCKGQGCLTSAFILGQLAQKVTMAKAARGTCEGQGRLTSVSGLGQVAQKVTSQGNKGISDFSDLQCGQGFLADLQRPRPLDLGLMPQPCRTEGHYSLGTRSQGNMRLQ